MEQNNGQSPVPSMPSAPPPPLPPPLRPPPPSRPARRGGPWVWIFILAAVVVVIGSVVWFGSFMAQALKGGGGLYGSSDIQFQEVTLESQHSSHKILVIPVEGLIFGGGLDRGGYNIVRSVRKQLKVAQRDPRIKAVVLHINSPGGEVLASDEISEAITQFQSSCSKPVVASMGSLAASGGYYVAAPCRWIVAHELTLTGSIGVIMHGYNYRSLMNKVGVRPEVFKSGRFKNMLSGDRELENISPEEQKELEAERKMLQSLVDQTFRRFKQVVADGRSRARKLNQTQGQALDGSWEEYADGRILSGKQAFELGFVDELGNLETAVNRAKKLAGIADADLVHYQQIMDLFSMFRLFGKSEPARITLDLGLELPKLQPGHLYLLSPSYIR